MLTLRQKEIWQFLDEYSKSNGQAPTIEEIRVHFELRSVSSVHKHLVALERRGAIRREAGAHRAIEVQALESVGGSDQLTSVPVVDDFRPPFPEEVVSTQERLLPNWMIGESGGGLPFLHQQLNQSMVGAGVQPGDWYLLKHCAQCIDEQPRLYGLSIDNLGSVVRYAWPEDNVIAVAAGENDMSAFRLRSDRVQICGQVLGVFRLDMQSGKSLSIQRQLLHDRE